MGNVKLNEKPTAEDFAYAYAEDSTGATVRVPKEKIHTLETDDTLTQSGIPADAKAVGNKFGKLSQEIAELKGDLVKISSSSAYIVSYGSGEFQILDEFYIRENGTVGVNAKGYCLGFLRCNINTFYAVSNCEAIAWGKTKPIGDAQLYDLSNNNIVTGNNANYLVFSFKKENLNDVIIYTVVPKNKLNYIDISYFKFENFEDNFQKALSYSHNIYIPEGEYIISGNIDLPENCNILGAGTYDTVLKFSSGGSFDFIGKSILAGGKHKAGLRMAKVTLRDNNLNVKTEPALKLICCGKLIFEDVFVNIHGAQILLKEAFDSRFVNCAFERGGEDEYSLNGIEFNSSDGLDTASSDYEYTNTILFTGCRFESFYRNALKSIGYNTSKLWFTNCKFESAFAKKGFALHFDKVNSLYFRDCFFVCRKDRENLFLYITNCNDIIITGVAEYAWGEYAGSNIIGIFNTGSGRMLINLQLTGINFTPNKENSYGLYLKGINCIPIIIINSSTNLSDIVN